MGGCIGLQRKNKSVSECESVNTTDTGLSTPEESGAPGPVVTGPETQEGTGPGSLTSTPEDRNTSAPLRELTISPIRTGSGSPGEDRKERLFKPDWEENTGVNDASEDRAASDEPVSVLRTPIHSSLKDPESSVSALGETEAEVDSSELDDTLPLPTEETRYVTATSEQSLLNDMGLPRLERCNAVRNPKASEKKPEE